jgi:two-component system phosphate regulon sensor histidine kinase PhoR
MKKKIADPVLMIATILIIVSFQVYWIKNNYDREKRLLNSKAGIVFRTAVFELQAKKLKLSVGNDTVNVHTNIKVVYKDSEEDKPIFIKNTSKEQVVGIADAIRRQVNDSIAKQQKKSPRIFVSVDNSAVLYNNDSGKNERHQRIKVKDNVLEMLYGIDSVKNAIQVTDIIVAVQKAFAAEKIPVSFSIDSIISRKDSIADELQPGIDELDKVTLGFAHPVSYKLQLENTFGYLFKKLIIPLSFSVFLIAITIFSFSLLYRNLNRQKRLTEIKNEFIGNITHELKTPISTVSVAIEAMQNFNALQNPERTKEYLVIANNELHRLGLLVDKVLRLSMFEKQEVELQLQQFDCKQLVNEVLDTMKLQFEKQQAVVSLTTTGTDFTLLADRMHITSVIYNLLDNALKYSREAPVVTIDLNATSDTVTLQIADKGIGIPAAYANKIFDKFFRVPSGNQHNVKGYGLGLSYVAHIIAQHKGTIGVKTEEGKGTAFTIQLPKHHENS